MKRMNRRKFLKTTGKLTLAGTAVLSIGPAISHLIPNPMKSAFALGNQAAFNVYNDVNSNAKGIVAHTFKDCLAQEWWPGICYKTSKPMVAVVAGTVTDVSNLADTTGYFYQTVIKEPNQAKGYGVRVVTGSNYSAFYLHLMTPKVTFGQKINRGQIIGHPDKKWNMPRLVINELGDQVDPNNYGVNHSYMNVWDGNTDLEIDKEEQNKRYETQQKILNRFAGMVEGLEKYTLLRKKHKGMQVCKWSPVEKFRYIEYLHQNKPETFPSLTKEQFGEMKKEFYSNQPIILTLPFQKSY
jgi:hypothetical protein